MLKPVVDDAITGETPVEKVLVVERNNEDVTWEAGRDYSYNELIKSKSTKCDAEPMESEDPLFLLYTSGSTGKPKGVQHNTAGYILWAQMTMEWVFDVKDNDTYWCTADIGWITGHSYIVYGPLLKGCTTIVFEGKPIGTPDAGAFWRVISEHKVSVMFTAPTAFRAIKKEDPNGAFLKKYDLSCFQALYLAGERLDLEVLRLL